MSENNFWQRISWLSQRWRTQRIAISSVNCRISWIIESLNAHCAFWYPGKHACLRICLYLFSTLWSEKRMWAVCSSFLWGWAAWKVEVEGVCTRFVLQPSLLYAWLGLLWTSRWSWALQRSQRNIESYDFPPNRTTTLQEVGDLPTPNLGCLII